MNSEERRNALNAELAQLKSNLAANTSQIGDWKIIKIYEARMKGDEDPYDFNELAELRQATRDRINEIREELESLPIEEPIIEQPIVVEEPTALEGDKEEEDESSMLIGESEEI